MITTTVLTLNWVCSQQKIMDDATRNKESLAVHKISILNTVLKYGWSILTFVITFKIHFQNPILISKFHSWRTARPLTPLCKILEFTDTESYCQPWLRFWRIYLNYFPQWCLDEASAIRYVTRSDHNMTVVQGICHDFQFVVSKAKIWGCK